MGDPVVDPDDLGRDLTLDDDDPELAAFFAGDDLADDPVPDGGKGLILEDPDGFD